jgi:hypothetical protein
MSKTKLSLFDKVDDGRNLECFVQPKVESMYSVEMEAKAGDGGIEYQDGLVEDFQDTQKESGPISITVTPTEAMME